MTYVETALGATPAPQEECLTRASDPLIGSAGPNLGSYRFVKGKHLAPDFLPPGNVRCVDENLNFCHVNEV
jgi:hypothetical protein